MIRWRELTLAAMLCCALAPLFAAEEAPDPVKLIEQLQHEDFETRRAAGDKLQTLGERARAALEGARTHADTEVRLLAQTLLQKLETSTLKLLAFDRSGKPADGAEADLQLYSTENSEWDEQRAVNATLDKTGAALLEEKFPLKARFNLNFRNWSAGDPRANYYSLDLRRGENILPVLALRPAKISGSVTDAEGKVLKDAQVSLVANIKIDEDLLEIQIKAVERWGGFAAFGGGTRALNGNTGDDGKVTIENVPEGVYGVLVKREGFAPHYVPAVRVREGRHVELPAVKLRPRKTGKLAVTLYGIDGKPAKGDIACVLEPVIDLPDDPRKDEKTAQLRHLLQQMRWNGERPAPDEKGKIELKDVPVGRYRLIVYLNNVCRCIDDVEIKDGETTDAGEVRSVAAGAIRGKVVDQEGKPLQGVSAFVARQKDFEAEIADKRINLNTLRQFYLSYGGGHTQAAGTYEVKNLPEGRYVLVLAYHHFQSAHTAIFDVDVPADRPVMAPQVKFERQTQQRKDVKGKVLLADGKPASGAQVVMLAGYSTSWFNCDHNGIFGWSQFYQDTVGQIVIVAPKHRPKVIDYSPGEFKADFTVNLETQAYGDVRIQVVDEAGQPLAGASVEPVAPKNQRYYWRQQRNLRELTDRDGVARLLGLCAGERKFTASKRGYVSKGELLVNVSTQEQTATIVLRKALEVSGHVEIPPGATYANMAVFAALPNNAGTVLAPVGPDGRFTLEGLRAGEYEITATAPGLIASEKQKLMLNADQTETPPVSVKMVAPAAIVAELSPAFRGYQAVVVPAGELNLGKTPDIDKCLNLWSPLLVDRDGRFEQPGLAPGKYDLLLMPPPDHFRGGYSYRHGGNMLRQVSARHAVLNLEARSVDIAAGIEKTPATMAALEPGSAVVEGNLVLSNHKGMPFCQLLLMLAGPNGFGLVQYNVPQELNRPPSPPPTLINAPEGVTITADQAARFRITGLPPGEYTLFGKLHLWNNAEFNKAMEPVKLKTVNVITPGETIALGEITFEVPAAILSKPGQPNKAVESEFLSDDTMQLFKP